MTRILVPSQPTAYTEALQKKNCYSPKKTRPTIKSAKFDIKLNKELRDLIISMILIHEESARNNHMEKSTHS